MKVLITGGMGVIGSMATRRFVEEGHRPVVMARHFDRALIAPYDAQVDVELADVLDLPRIISIIQSYRITHIVHTAALIGVLSHRNPPQSVHINVIGTLNILEAARIFGVKRVVYTSAKGVYGDITGEHDHPVCKPFNEDHPKNPRRIYESAKLMGEHMGQFYKATYGLEFVALRFSQTYGPGKSVEKWGGRAIPSQIIEGAYGRKPVRVEKGGDQITDFVYTKDAGNGIYLATTADVLNYTAYNIGTGVGVTLKNFGEEVKRLIPEADIEIGGGLDYMGERRYGILDITRAQQDLGYRPQYMLRKAVEDYIGTLSAAGSSIR